MTKSISERVHDSFTGKNRDFDVKEFSKDLLVAWKDTSNSLSRNVFVAFLFMAIFELLIYQRASAVISIGTFNLVNAPIVQVAIPAVVAFISYEGIRLSARWIEIEEAYEAAIKVYAKGLVDNDLDFLIRPDLPSFWHIGNRRQVNMLRREDKLMDSTNFLVSIIVIVVVPIAFECQAYYELISKFGYRDVLLWISVGITALFVIGIVVYLIIGQLLHNKN